MCLKHAFPGVREAPPAASMEPPAILAVTMTKNQMVDKLRVGIPRDSGHPPPRCRRPSAIAKAAAAVAPGASVAVFDQLPGSSHRARPCKG